MILGTDTAHANLKMRNINQNRRKSFIGQINANKKHQLTFTAGVCRCAPTLLAVTNNYVCEISPRVTGTKIHCQKISSKKYIVRGAGNIRKNIHHINLGVRVDAKILFNLK